MTKQAKINSIAIHFRAIMETLGMDLQNDSLKDTPNRVAKMYVNELFAGMHDKPPKATTFENTYGSQILLVRNIEVSTVCEHHMVPFIGKAFIGYIPAKKVLGLSKFHRVTDYFCKRPQIQERLISDIGKHLIKVLGTEDVMVVIKAEHYCTKIRGVKNPCSDTVNSFISGRFSKAEVRAEFFTLLKT